MIRQFLGKILIFLVRLYQIGISPFLMPCCRFYPSCSEYMIGAIKKHGPYKGLWYGTLRLLRCHPFHPGGYDPVK
ncbi:MAG: membrane protein insertion efficiency factor YidD [Deltaproteobacteria bacterium]|nr:membrane protein insertion efficiency factor YidD [Deltaproteobacteria bacterium]